MSLGVRAELQHQSRFVDGRGRSLCACFVVPIFLVPLFLASQFAVLGRAIFRAFLLHFLLFCLVLHQVPLAQAQLKQVAKKAPPVDVRVVVDISGSMRKSDPQNMRRPAVQLAAEMIPAGSVAGVWTFGRFVNMLVPLRRVDDPWREKAKAAADKINSVALFTNIPEAIEKAAYGWSDPPGETARSLILLTDGKVDISKDAAENARARQDVLSRLVPMLRATQAKVHTIAMSEDVDVELLRALSYETDGRFQTVRSREDLVRVFVDAFDASVPSQQVPLDTSNRFAIDSGVKEFTLLVHKTPNATETALRTPSGKLFAYKDKPNQVRWFTDPRLDVITVTQPEPGEWQLMASVDPDNRVTVISDLVLSLSGLPNNVLKGETITLDIHFEDKNGVITNPDFLGLVDLSFSQNYIDGNKVWQGDLTSYSKGNVRTPDTGIYEPRLEKSLLPGQHELTVIAEGRTFTRKVVQKVSVIEQAVQVFLTPPTEVDQPFNVRVEPVAGLLDKGLRVRAKVQAPNRVVQDIEMIQTQDADQSSPKGGGQGQVLQADGFLEVSPQPTASKEVSEAWVGSFDPYGGVGIYRVIVQAVGQTPTGRPIDNKLGPFEAEITAELLGLSAEESQIELPFDKPESEPVVEEVVEQAPEPESVEDPDETIEEEVVVELEDEELLEDDELLDEELLDEEQVEEEETTEEASEPLPKWIIGVAIAGVNLILMVVGFIFYRRAVKKRQAEDAMEDARLAEATQADVSEYGVNEEQNIPDGIPDIPDMDDDDEELDEAFDLSKTGNE